MAKQIIVRVAPDGNVKIETRGYQGSECMKATADLEKALGVKTSDVKTREYSEQPTTATATQRQHG